MHRLIMVLGALIAFVGVLFFVLIVITARNQPGIALMTAIMSGGGMLISGAILYSFGAVVEHLIAIRRNTEQQLKIFQERLGS